MGQILAYVNKAVLVHGASFAAGDNPPKKARVQRVSPTEEKSARAR